MTAVKASYPAAGMSRAEFDALGVTCDLPTAARALSIGRTLAYEAARDGRFPVPVIKIGSRIIVRTADLRRLIYGDGEQ